jgi:hypothetical protein
MGNKMITELSSPFLSLLCPGRSHVPKHSHSGPCGHKCICGTKESCWTKVICSISSLMLGDNSVTSIDNTQLSLYLGYKRKVSYSHYSHIQLYKCIRVLWSSDSLCSSSHLCPTHSYGIMLLASSSVRPSY